MPINVRAVTSSRHSPTGLVEHSACETLRQLARQVPAGQAIVELGAYQGRSTGWLLVGAQEGNGAHVTTVDPWQLRASQSYTGGSRRFTSAYRHFKTHMRQIGATGRELTVIRGFATEAGNRWQGARVGLLWHDAGHGEQEVATDLAAWLPHMAPRSTVVLHDACRERYGVMAGAAKILDGHPDWDWENRVIQRWRRRPRRRGLLIVRRRV